MNTKESSQNYIILISILSFFVLGGFSFVVALLLNGASFPFLNNLNKPELVEEINTEVDKVNLVKFNGVVLESEKFREMVLNGGYVYSTSTLKIGKREPFGGISDK